jgi:sugar phosphate isomerase/epimerase
MIQEATGGDMIGENTRALKGLLINNALSCLKQMTTFIEPEKICIENLPSTSSEFLEGIVKRCGLSICLDIGHLMVRGDNLEDFLTRHSKRIREIHLHDVKHFHYGPFVHVKIDHQALGQGCLPIQSILDLVSRHGFSGPLVLETLRDSEITSIKILKDLLAQRTH